MPKSNETHNLAQQNAMKLEFHEAKCLDRNHAIDEKLRIIGVRIDRLYNKISEFQTGFNRILFGAIATAMVFGLGSAFGVVERLTDLLK